MRIAICLSGQPRTWKYCVKPIRKFFETHHRVDYFIATWDTDLWKGNGVWTEEPSDTDGIREAYDAKSCRIMKWDGRGKGTWHGMFHSMDVSLHDKRMYEAEHGFTYDVVVKARLDQIVNPTLGFSPYKTEPMTLYTNNHMERMPKEFYGANLSDIYFYGTSHTMDVMSGISRGLSRDDQFSRGPGVLLWRWANQHGIHCSQSLSLPQWTIMRREFIGLDPQLQYDEIVKLQTTWIQ